MKNLLKLLPLVLLLWTSPCRGATAVLTNFNAEYFTVDPNAASPTNVIKLNFTNGFGTNVFNTFYVTNLYATTEYVTNLFVTYLVVSNIVAGNIQGTTNTLAMFTPDGFSVGNSIVTQNDTNSIMISGPGTGYLVFGPYTNVLSTDGTNPTWNGVPIGDASLWTNNAGTLQPFPEVDQVYIIGASDVGHLKVLDSTEATSIDITALVDRTRIVGASDGFDARFSLDIRSNAGSQYDLNGNRGGGGTGFHLTPDADGATNNVPTLQVNAASRTAGDIITVFADPVGDTNIFQLGIDSSDVVSLKLHNGENFGFGLNMSQTGPDVKIQNEADGALFIEDNDAAGISISGFGVAPTSDNLLSFGNILGNVWGDMAYGGKLYTVGYRNTGLGVSWGEMSHSGTNGSWIFNSHSSGIAGDSRAIRFQQNATDQLTIGSNAVTFTDQVLFSPGVGTGSGAVLSKLAHAGNYGTLSFVDNSTTLTLNDGSFYVQPGGAFANQSASLTKEAIMNNPGNAILGTQAWSPGLSWRGAGWSTGTGSSRAVKFNTYVEPVQGSEATGLLTFYARIESNTPTTPLKLSSEGPIILASITKAQKTAILNPVDGMLVYQSDNTPGPRMYVSGAWKAFTLVADP